jgi:hypothetical protein
VKPGADLSATIMQLEDYACSPAPSWDSSCSP